MPQYLIHFAQYHTDFRIPELEALAALTKIPIEYDKDSYSNDSPFLLCTLPSDQDAQKLVERGILIKEIVHLWSLGDTLEDVHKELQQRKDFGALCESYKHASFNFKVEGFNNSLSAQEQLEIINSYSYLAFEGKIDLKNADAKFMVYYHFETSKEHDKNNVKIKQLKKVYFGRLVGIGARETVAKYSLKKRKYIGITSMDAELSLIMSNMGLIRKGHFVLDPFVGTGSFLVTAAHYGAYTMGMDIDGRQIRGKGDGNDVYSNAKQYHLDTQVLDCLVTDMAAHPLRQSEWFDAIITDPPYGVRAGAKRIGTPQGMAPRTESPIKANGEYMYPRVIPYELDEVLVDLVDFAAKMLKKGGRLVFWMPTPGGEFKNADIPQHPIMKLISHPVQPFGKWSRRLVTMEKIKEWEGECVVGYEEAPAHKKFLDVYFSKSDRRLKNEVVHGL